MKPMVRDVVTPDVTTVGLDTTYDDIAALLTHNRINAVPVVDDLRRPAGVVSEGDLLRRVEYLDEPPTPNTCWSGPPTELLVPRPAAQSPVS